MRALVYDLLAEACDAAGDPAGAYQALRRATDIRHAMSHDSDIGLAQLLEETARARYAQMVADERRASRRALNRTHRVLAAALARERRMRLELARIAVIDPLTGTYNRRGLDERGAEMLTEARQRGWPLVAIMLDLDRFKGGRRDWSSHGGSGTHSQSSWW